MKYLVVERWEEFQHYKNRAPLWIKNYTRLLHDDVYLELSGHRRAILHGLWLVYASSACRLLFDHRSLSRRLNLRVTSADLQALRKAGYITTSASKPLAPRKQDATQEKEKEKEKELTRAVALDVANGPGFFSKQAAARIERLMDEHTQPNGITAREVEATHLRSIQ